MTPCNNNDKFAAFAAKYVPKTLDKPVWSQHSPDTPSKKLKRLYVPVAAEGTMMSRGEVKPEQRGVLVNENLEEAPAATGAISINRNSSNSRDFLPTVSWSEEDDMVLIHLT